MFKNKKPKHLRLGTRGEVLAAELILSFNIEIITKNYRTNGGEIDIIAWDGKQLIFIEVKTRKNDHFLNNPADAVGFHKKQRLKSSALQFMRTHNLNHLCFRFDVIAISFKQWKLIDVRWIKSFFKSSDLTRNEGIFEYE